MKLSPLWQLLTLCSLILNPFYVSAKDALIRPLASHSLLTDIAQQENLMLAVGERGHILRSTDHGAHWKQVAVPTNSLLTSIFILDKNTAWVTGHEMTLLSTSDGGVTWQVSHRQAGEDQPLLDVWFKDRQNGIAIGAYGALLSTQDAGKNWHNAPLQLKPSQHDSSNATALEDEEFLPDYHLNNLMVARDNTLYIAAEAGFLYRSDDGGTQWQVLESPYEGSFYGIIETNDHTLLAHGLRGHIFRSTNRGQSWQLIPSDTTALLSGAKQFDDGAILIVGTGGAALLSKDDGQSFTPLHLGNRHSYASVVTPSSTQFITVGNHGIEKHTLTTKAENHD